jgi:hypothetical protein
MAGIPKVKITFDADFDELKKGIKGGQNEIESFGSKVGDFGKKAGLAFAAAGIAAAAYASKDPASFAAPSRILSRCCPTAWCGTTAHRLICGTSRSVRCCTAPSYTTKERGVLL